MGLGSFNILDRDYLSNFMGLTISKPNLKTYMLLQSIKTSLGSDTDHEFRKSAHRVVLVNTFWGLNKQALLPPNIIVTGPLIKDSSELLLELQTQHSELYEWLNKSKRDGKQVVYVSLGTVCQWNKWSVDAIFNGLKRLDVRVIWSLNNPDLLPTQNDPAFFTREWLPQAQILAHPAVRAGLSHCGFGGVLEFMSNGVPIACFPHFGDQGPNTNYILEIGAGISLIDPKKGSRSFID
mmetsp:Transcript_13813/g.23561  ORF Transcript_13813/g.23561 Transcript_13813/m.23561 type:complete len:237 (+) Transcript_13813:108-818(+)